MQEKQIRYIKTMEDERDEVENLKKINEKILAGYLQTQRRIITNSKWSWTIDKKNIDETLTQ